MEPIINPWVFYWLDFVDDVDAVCAVALIIEGVIFAFATLALILSEGDTWEATRKGVKVFTIVSVLTIIAGIVIPSSDTIYKMIAASFVTPDNITLAVDGATQAKDALVKDALTIIQTIANGVSK